MDPQLTLSPIDDSSLKKRMYTLKFSKITSARRFQPWQPFCKCSAMLIGILLFLLGFFQIVYMFYKSNSLVKLPDKFPINISQSKYLPATKISFDINTYKANLTVDEYEPNISCVFGILESEGAFGNRMFIFASAYGLARLHACHLYVHPKIIFQLRSTFTINFNKTPVKILNDPTEFENRTDVFRRYSACTLFDDLRQIPLPQNYTRYELVGFYQAYGYFEFHRKEIEQLFEFNEDTVKTVIPFVQQMIFAVWNHSINFYANNNTVKHDTLKSFLRYPPLPLRHVTWIGVHIRRNDFLTFFRIDTSTSYLYWAFDYYRQKYINCRFIIASDDKPYAKKHFANFSDVFITPLSFYYGHDLATLALCEHSILTAGTYSWWAAWLAGGIAIHDLNYPVPSQNCIKQHYFPPWFIFPHNSSSKQWDPPPK